VFLPHNMQSTISTTKEQEAISILHEARIYLRFIEGSPFGPGLVPTWEDYEACKARLVRLRLAPEQHALCCGMLAKVLGL